MTIIDYLYKYRGKYEPVDSFELVKYFAKNFISNEVLDNFHRLFPKHFIDASKFPETILTREIAGLGGIDSENLYFMENPDFNGMIDLDKINNKLVNVRIQIFSEGVWNWSRKRKILRKYLLIKNYLDNNFVFEDNILGEGLAWGNEDFLLMLRKDNNPVPYLSFTVTDNRYI